MATEKKILLSGVQPTGRPHVGNYFGAMKQFADLQNDYESQVMIADFHALISVQDKEKLSSDILDLAIDYLAIGLDPNKVLLYQQSSVPEVTELCWIFNCLTTMPYLMRAHAFKDAEAKKKEINVGLFEYPVLMAADILMFDPDIVPVGQDNKQHLEIAREIATKFNNTYGETFKLPQELIMPNVKTVPGTDGQKMSKSYKNTIPLFASDEEIQKIVMSIVTDSASGVPTNVRAIHALFRDEKYLAELYESKKGKYKDLKDALAEDLIAFIAPMRERRAEIAKNRDAVLQILKEGGVKAREKAEKKMELVRKAVGISF